MLPLVTKKLRSVDCQKKYNSNGHLSRRQNAQQNAFYGGYFLCIFTSCFLQKYRVYYTQDLKRNEVKTMTTLQQMINYVEQGFAVYFGSYYGETLMESMDEIKEGWMDVVENGGDNGYLYIQSVDVDMDVKEIHVFIGDDE